MLGDLSETVDEENLTAEDVINRMAKTKSRNKKQLTREQIEAAIIKKKKTEKRALDIIHRLMEDNTDEQTLKQCAEHLTQNHYNDLVDERAITDLCGYPICENSLPQVRTSQKYRIDLRSKKVYELTERKKFCSDGCFEASDYFKKQLATCPSWMLDIEKIPPIVLLSHKTIEGKRGDEVLKLNRFKRTEQTDTQKEAQKRAANYVEGEDDTSVLDTTHDVVASILKEMTIKERANDEGQNNTRPEDRKSAGANDINSPKGTDRRKNKEGNVCVGSSIEKETSNNLPQSKWIQRTGDGNSGNGNPHQPRQQDTAGGIKGPEERQDSPNQSEEEAKNHPFAAIFRMEQNLREWVTPDTFKLILREEQLRNILRLKGDSFLEWEASAGTSASDPDFRTRYAILCRRLDMQEIDEALFGKEEDKVELQPLPSYDQLLKDHEEEERKVAAFMRGKEVVFRDELSQKQKRSVKERQDLEEPTLPLVDKHNQMELRREIVNHHLEQVLQNAVKALSIPSYKRTWQMTRELVGTFELTSNNITYSPPIWTLLGLAVLHLLSLKDRPTEEALKQPVGQEWMCRMLAGYGLDSGYLHRLGSYLTDIDYILSKCAAPTFGTL